MTSERDENGGGHLKTYDTPGAAVRALRKGLGLSLKEVASRVGGGTHFTTIAKLENGKMLLTYDWARKLAPVLNVTTLSLMMAEEHDHPAKTIPVFAGLADIIRRTEAPAASRTAYLTHRDNLFGYNFIGSPDIGGETSLYTAIIDPDQCDLINGVTFAIAEYNSGSCIIGVYRSEGVPRIIPWPAVKEQPIFLAEGDTEVLGIVLELQRHLWRRDS